MEHRSLFCALLDDTINGILYFLDAREIIFLSATCHKLLIKWLYLALKNIYRVTNRSVLQFLRKTLEKPLPKARDHNR